MQNQKFRKLDVWTKAMDFIEQVYLKTGGFSREEL
jgi:hypothetical protein